MFGRKNALQWLQRSVGCLGLLFSLYFLGQAYALTPPSDGFAQYRKDGTLVERQAFAKRLGNNQFNPALVGNVQRALAPNAVLPAPPSGWQGGLPASGNPKVVVLLIDFPDYPASGVETAATVSEKFFGSGVSSQYPYESLKNFYQRSSYNALTIGGNVLGWYRATHNRSYYEGLGDGAGNEALVSEAMNYYASPAGGSHNFAQYDNDNNGYLDAVYVKWTGPIGAWASFWWAYQTGWYSNPSYTISGKKVGKYVWSWILDTNATSYSPRTDIHETGHLLGLPDYYDYDDLPPYSGVGYLDMMDGNWGDHNAFSKAMLGWVTPSIVASGTQTRSLNPSGTSGDAVLVMPSASGSLFSEFFLAQYRKRGVGNDSMSYPTDGLTIWHVDATLNSAGNNFLYNNQYTNHKLLKLMQADGLEQIEAAASSQADAGDFYVSPKSLTPATVPNSSRYNGTNSDVHITNISAGGSSNMTATFSIGSATTYLLAVSKSGNGTINSSPGGISCGTVCSASFNSGANVSLTATPSTGYLFSGWGGACSGTSGCSVGMTGAKNVSASFSATSAMRQITVTKTGNGTINSSPAGISCGVACSTAMASFPSTSSVSFTATPDNGHVLSGWSGACAGTGSCSVAAGTTAASVGAIFIVGTAPTLTTTSPLDEATGVDPASSLAFTFSAPIQRGSGTVTLKTMGGTVFETYNVASSSALNISGNTLTIKPTKNLGIFTNYTVDIPLGAIKDLNGMAYAGLNNYNFRTATLDSLYNFFVVAFSAAPGATYMGQLAEAYNYGLTVQEIVDIFTAKPQFTDTYPTTLTHQQLATALINNIVKSSASESVKSAGASQIAEALDFGWTVGRTVYQVFGNLAAMPTTDASWGNTAKQFQNQLVVARYFTEVMGNTSTDLAALRNVIARVDHNSDVSTVDKIITLIGTVP